VPPRSARLALLGALLLPLGACNTYGLFSFPPQARGEQVDPDDIAQLVPGTSTRKDVNALLGTPTAKAPFDDNTWIYVSQITRPVIAGTQSVRNQHVYALTFDANGVLRNVVQKDKADGLPVQVVSRTTPSPGSEASFMQQLIGNIGRFNPTGQPISNAPASTNTPGNGS
jgi:outer membrane protein assembly factor BamE (lipoprotein component of BamABCDE complex)